MANRVRVEGGRGGEETTLFICFLSFSLALLRVGWLCSVWKKDRGGAGDHELVVRRSFMADKGEKKEEENWRRK